MPVGGLICILVVLPVDVFPEVAAAKVDLLISRRVHVEYRSRLMLVHPRCINSRYKGCLNTAEGMGLCLRLERLRNEYVTIS